MANNSLALVAANFDGVLLADGPNHMNRIEIKSRSSTRVYVVSQHKTTGEWQCGCPGWCFKKPGQPRSCAHLKAMVPALNAALRQGQVGSAKPAPKALAPVAKAATVTTNVTLSNMTDEQAAKVLAFAQSLGVAV